MKITTRIWYSSQEEGAATHFSILAWRISMDRGAWWATVLGVTCPWPLSQNSKLAPFHDFLFSKTHDESHVLSPCLKTQLASTDKSPEIPVLKPELPPCSPAVMEMARPGARWLVSMEPRNSLPSIQGLLLLFRKLLSKWDRTQPSLYSQIPLFLPGTVVQVD